MDDAKFLYFTTLIKYSITNKPFIIIIKIIEFFPILIDCMANPIRVKNYFKGIEKSYSSKIIEKKNMKRIYNLSYFRRFRNLRNTNDLYPLYLLFIVMIILLFYDLFFFLVILVKKTKYGNINNIKKRKGCFFLLKIFLINLYDHFIFRCISLFLYDIIIAYLCKSKNYFVLILMSLIFFYFIYLNIDYFISFRLCIKFDIENKYIYDDKFILTGDVCLTFLKLALSLEYNIDDDKICYFFNIIMIIIPIIGTIKFFIEPIYNIIGIFYGFFFINFICLFTFNLIFNLVADDSYIFIAYIIVSFIIPLLITYKSIKQKYYTLIRTPMEDNNKQIIQQFELLCEYYQTPHFNYLLRNICFNNKIRDNEVAQLIKKNSTFVGEDETVVLNNVEVKRILSNSLKNIKKELKFIFFNKFGIKFKQYSEQPNYNKNLNLFYYYISKIFMELMSEVNNYFQLIFEIRKILGKLKLTNYIHYINLRYFYQILCHKHSMIENNNMLFYNESIFKTFNKITEFIKDLEKFLSNDFTKNPIDFISFSSNVAKTEFILKNSYQHIITNSIKNEYQKLLLRIILEGLLNKIFSLSGLMLISGDIGMYEEVLDKYYNNEKVLKIKVDLLNRTSKIVKIGKDLNIYWNRSFDHLIPQEFQKIGIDKFFNDESQIENNRNFSPQKFHFIVWNKFHDLKQFVYEYLIYPKLEDNIAYVDGTYRLGKDILVVTKKYIHSEKEIILTLSNSLEKIMFINKNLLTILNRYDIRLELNDFLQDENTFMYDLTKYCSYIYGKIKKLESICNPEEIKIVNQLIEHLNQTALIRTKRTRYQFVYLFSIFDKDYENCFYSIKQYKSENKGITIRKEKSIVNWQLKDEDFQSISKNNKNKEANKNIQNFNTLYSSFAFDTKSQASQQSVSSTLFSINTNVGRKKIDTSNSNHNRNYIIIIFNIFLIIISVFCLIYENFLNLKLKKKMKLYSNTYIFNRFLLNLMVSYLSLLKICDNNNNCNQFLSKYISKFDSFKELNKLISLELYSKMEDITSLFNNLKTDIEKCGVKEIAEYSSIVRNEMYLSYNNNSLVLNKLAPKRFDYLMKTFINKLIMTTNNDFSNINIYQIIVDENFNPTEILINNSSELLSETQIYIYEIMITYLDYSNHYYSLQENIEKNSNKQLKYNKVSLIIFIIALIISNLFIMSSCLLLLNYFHKIIDKRISMMETLLRNQLNNDKLIERINLIKDLVKFYSKPPMEILIKLSENMKKQENKKNKNEINEKQIEIFDLPDSYSLLFIMKKYLIIVFTMTIIFLIYCLIFIKISNNSFNTLKNLMKIIENSSYSENLTYVMVGVIQLLQYIKIPEHSLYITLSSLFDNKKDFKIDENSNFFLELFSNQQEIYLAERREKQNDNSNPIDSEIIDFNCDTFFQNVNNERFNKIIQSYPDKNYLEQMINFCNHINIMEFKNEEIYMDVLYFSILKLLLINSEHITDFPEYDMNDLCELSSQILIIYRPYKNYLSDYYLDIVLTKKLKIHLYTLLFFLLGNIFLEVVFFCIIKFFIIDHVDGTNKNLNKLLRILKVI